MAKDARNWFEENKKLFNNLAVFSFFPISSAFHGKALKIALLQHPDNSEYNSGLASAIANVEIARVS